MRKVSHFYREPLKVIKEYSQDELNKVWGREEELQPEAIRFIYCTVSPDELLEVIAIPGGSARLPLHLASRLKISGVRAGVYDLMLLWKNGGIAFIELKAGASPSIAQKEFGAYLVGTNHRNTVCRKLVEIREFLRTCNLKCRDTSHSP